MFKRAMDYYQQASLLLFMIITSNTICASVAPIEKNTDFGAGGNYVFTTANASYNCTLSQNSPDATITFYATYTSSTSCSSGILTFNLFNQIPAPVLLPNSTYHITSSFVNAAVTRMVKTFSLATPACMAITNLYCDGHGLATYSNRFWNISCDCTGASCTCSLVSSAPYPQVTFPP